MLYCFSSRNSYLMENILSCILLQMLFGKWLFHESELMISSIFYKKIQPLKLYRENLSSHLNTFMVTGLFRE